MKIKKLLSFVLAGIMVFSFSACKDSEEPEKPEEPVIETPEIIEPIDPNWPVTAFGTEIKAQPEKVAVASPALAEYIFDMGLMEKICAVPDYCGFSGASSYPTIGSVRLPDMEAIKEAAPEYILTFAKFEESILIELQQMNITVINIKAPENLDELRAVYKEIAFFFKGAVDGISVGEAYVEKYNSELSALAYSGEQKSAAFIRGLDYMMITGGTMEQELLSAAGIINVAEAYSGYTFPEENWKEFDPDVIFLNSNLHLIDLETSDLYKKKAAVKGDKVYNIEIDVLAIGSMHSFAVLKDILSTVYEDYTGGTVLEPAYPSMYQK